MNIPYSTRSKFLAPLVKALAKRSNSAEFEFNVEVSLESGGYDADVLVEILSSNIDCFRADLTLSDPSRFPSRVRAAATALRDVNQIGQFRIQHYNGHVIISRASANLTDQPQFRATDTETQQARISTIIHELTSKQGLRSRDEIFSTRSFDLSESGIYAWYFRELPPQIPTDQALDVAGFRLLYLGISPRRAASKNTLPQRLRGHFGGTAEGSTLRLSLGCLLAEELELELFRIGKSKHFCDGENRLSQWMSENARVAFAAHPTPWSVEQILIDRFNLPLNLEYNTGHSFYGRLSQLRSTAKANARVFE